MAITATGTIARPTDKLPSGFTVPVVAPLTNPSKEPFTNIAFTRATYAHATAATGLTQLIAGVKAWVEATFLPGLGVLAASTITARFVITNVKDGYSSYTEGDEANQYKTGTAQYIVSGYVEWVFVA